MLLSLLYWIILVLAIIGVFLPPTSWPNAGRMTNLVLIVLLIIIGLRDFRMPIQ